MDSRDPKIKWIEELQDKIDELKATNARLDEVVTRQRELLENCKTRLSSFYEENIELKKRLARFEKDPVPALCKAG